MKKLTRYTNFKDLKSDKGLDEKNQTKKPMGELEFEEFIFILRNNIVTAKRHGEIKTVHGK